MKKLSIIIPSFNSEKTIRACIESVVAECKTIETEYEILVVDDGSSDASPKIIQELADENKNIVYIHQENAGPSSARNKGLSCVSGDFIALNDSDDVWLQGKLKVQLQYLEEHKDVDLVTCQYGNSVMSSKAKIITFKDMAFHNYFSTMTVLFRNCIKEIRFPEDMKYSEDMRFFLTIMLKHKCAYMPFMAAQNFYSEDLFRETGLSSRLGKMEKGELSNIFYIFKEKKISFPVYLCAICFSLMKFLRRCLFYCVRKIQNKK